MTQTDILHNHLPFSPWSDPALSRLPGMRRVDGEVLLVDDGYTGQMALKADLIAKRRDEVLAKLPGSDAALQELLGWVLANLPNAFSWEGEGV